MGNDEDVINDALATFRAKIEERVREQLRRHSKINPNFNPLQIVDIQIKQERERLERRKKRYEEEGDIIGVEVAELLMVWLPQLAGKIKRLYH